MSWYRQQLEDWLKTIHINADLVFDVGGGSNPVKKRVGSWNVGNYVIFDNGIEEEVPDTPIVQLDLNEEYDELPSKEQASVIFCLEVFEYIYNPLQALKTLNRMLKLGGTLYITFPFVYPLHQPIAYDSLRYTRYGVLKLLEKAGFNIASIQEEFRIDRSGMLELFYENDGMHPAKGENHKVDGFLIAIKK